MKSDVDELFKTTKPSFLDLVGQQAQVTSHQQIKGTSRSFRRPIFFLAAFLLLLGGSVGGYFFLFKTQQPEVEPRRLATLAPFFATESSRTITADPNRRNEFLRLFDDAYQESERGSTMKRLLIKLQDGPQEYFAQFSDAADLLRLTIPAALLLRTQDPAMTFFYYQKEGGTRFGLATRVTDFDRTWRDLLSWEASMVRDLRPLLFSEKIDATITPFEDRTYRNIDWRYQKLSEEQDMGIAYTVFPAKNIVVIATSKEMMETAINRLFDAR